MKDYIDRMNNADQLASFHKEGVLTFIEAQEAMTSLGFSDIELKEDKIWARATSAGIQMPFGAVPYPFCRMRQKCIGTGRCQSDWVCND